MGETAWRVTPRSATAPVEELEPPAEPVKLDIEPVGDAQLSFMTLDELERSRSEINGHITDEIHEDLDRSRSRFWKDLERSRSSRSFIREDLRSSNSTRAFDDMMVVDGTDVEQPIDRNHHFSKSSGVIGQEHFLPIKTQGQRPSKVHVVEICRT